MVRHARLHCRCFANRRTIYDHVFNGFYFPRYAIFPAIKRAGGRPLQWSIVFLILFAAALHASWNVLIKAESSDSSNTVLIIAGSAVLGVVFLPFVPLPLAAAGPTWALPSLSILFISALCSWLIKRET